MKQSLDQGLEGRMDWVNNLLSFSTSCVNAFQEKLKVFSLCDVKY